MERSQFPPFFPAPDISHWSPAQTYAFPAKESQMHQNITSERSWSLGLLHQVIRSRNSRQAIYPFLLGKECSEFGSQVWVPGITLLKSTNPQTCTRGPQEPGNACEKSQAWGSLPSPSNPHQDGGNEGSHVVLLDEGVVLLRATTVPLGPPGLLPAPEPLPWTEN